MRHLVTLSLVFFSLTHLAKAERVEGLRLVTEQYCNKQQINAQLIVAGTEHPDEPQYPFFLSNNELSIHGLVPEVRSAKYRTYNQFIADLAIREKPKNNSP